MEAGVEADLCGPTCVPRPCNSTATQTPASPLSTSPECEASVGEEASGSACFSNDGVTDELLQDDHPPPLTPQHRPLYQRMSVSEEEVEEESVCGHEMAVSCEHAIYAPKPTYDQLDQYSSPTKKQEEKQRRSGLGTTIAPQAGGVSSESEGDGEEEALARRGVTFCPPPMARRNRPPLTRQPRSVSVSVFPSLQDAQLKALGVSAFDRPTNKNLSPQEIENKFKQLSLAFKTDRLTLQQRRIVQQSQIENAETNFTKELNHLKASLLALHENCIDQDINDAVIQVRKHLDVVTLSSSSLLTASEGWGAIQQELSISQAVEVLLLHVENVIRLYESDHQELMEMRKLIDEHDTDLPISPVAATSGQSSSTDSPIAPSRRIRALSLAILSKQQSHEVGSRRISLVPGSSKTVFKDVGGRHSRRRASLMPDLRPYHQELTALAASASCLSKDKTEEKRHSTNGMLKSSITEEGSESGDEVPTNTQAGASESSPMAPSLTNLTDFPVDLYDSSLQDSDQRSDEEVGPSPIHTPTAESHVSNNPATSLAPQSQHWLMVVVEDVLGWVRGGQWPFSLQQTYQGARYAFTSLLLLLAAFFLLLTISSGNDTIHRPCHPGWATVGHVLHPFVTICHAGTPPT